MGIQINDNMLYSLNFADDQVIFAEDIDDTKYMLRNLNEAYDKWGLEINFTKTKYMVVGGENQDLQLDMGDSVIIIKHCNDFQYLGSNISHEGGSTSDIANKITRGKAAIRQLHPVIWNRGTTMHLKQRLYKSIIEPITLYGSEVWEITEKSKKKLRAVEMEYWRRCCALTKLDKIRNEEIRNRVGVSIDIIDTIESKRLSWYGHMRRMKNDRWPMKIWAWQPQQRRKRGRPRLSWSVGVKQAMDRKGLQEEDWQDRRLWKLRSEKRRTV